MNGATFAAGEVGQGFSLDGVSAHVKVPASTSLDVGQADGLTVETWIKPADVGNGHSVIEWSHSPGGAPYGTHLWVGHPSHPPGYVFANLADTQGGYHVIDVEGVVVAGQLQHLALTYSKTSGLARLLVNGAVVREVNLGTFTPQTSYDLYFGCRPPGDGYNTFYAGIIDEMSLYNRALSTNEIQAIYNVGASGKCNTPAAPFLFSQPADQTVIIGDSASFTVAAGGTAPLSYQWRLNGADLPGATNAVLALTNIQTNQAGNYAVLVSNAVGFVLSSNALLTVNPVPPCFTPPAGMVSWWPAEADALDAVGDNNGGLLNLAGFAPGKVGQAFAFNGVNQLVQIPNAPSLNPTNALTLEAWINVSAFSANDTVAIVGKDDPYSSARQFMLGMVNITGKWMFRAHLGVPGSYLFYTGTTRLQTNTWYHTAFTYDGSALRLYVNGSLEGSLAVSGPILATANPLLIGGHASGPWNFNGRVDELSLYSRALSATEIQAIYQAAGSGKCLVPMPPFITSQPAGQTAVAGADVTFNVGATGTRPLSYQWLFNGAPLTDATNASLTVTGVSTNAAGIYAVQVTNLYGAVLSSNAVLAVRDLGPTLWDAFDPAIDMPQWSAFGGTVQANNYGGAVSGTNSLWFGGNGSRFAVTRPLNTSSGGNIRFYLRLASGSSSIWETADLPGEGVVLEYSINKGTNWVEMGRYDTSAYFNWTSIALSVPTAAQAPATQFRWRQLSNSGAGCDNWALDDVLITTGPTPPMIVTQPQPQTNLVGETAAFTVVAAGSTPLGYQWRWNGTDLNGATASSLVLTNVQLTDAGAYSVLVSNAFGTALSSNALLTVNTPPPAVAPPAGLISWWRGEANLLDHVSGNNGSNSFVTFVPGKVGQAFNFDGLTNYMTIPAASNLAVQSFTIEAWICPADLTTPRPIVEYGAGGGKISPLNFWYNWTGSSAVPGSLYGIVRGTNGIYLQITAAARVLASNQWSHVAFTFDAAKRQAFLYVNGIAVASNTAAITISAQTSVPVNLGYRPVGSGDPWGGRRHLGKLDEVSIYNRALAATEFQAIYAAGGSGKSAAPVAPVLFAQPSAQTVIVGDDASFQVVAGGTQPLSYQWQLNGLDLVGATNAVLTLTNVQIHQAGSYSVLVSNVVGAITSSNAVLTVNAPPPCAPLPAGAVAWWSGNGSAGDTLGTNNGLFQNPSFTRGTVGQAFKFDGTGNNVKIPASTVLDLGASSGFTVEAWINPASLTSSGYPIVEWAVDGGYGVHFYANYSSAGSLAGNVFGTDESSHLIVSPGGILVPNQFQHVAFTYDKTSGIARLFRNGVVVQQANLGVITPKTSSDLYIGCRPSGSPYGPIPFVGAIDEVTLYQRALSTNEIQAVYLAGSSGKCTTPALPWITFQPVSQSVTVGDDVTFQVLAGGTQPLGYQWQFNGGELAGATNAVLVLTNVQVSQAGSYAVVVSNLVGVVTSSNALLGVHPPPAAIQMLGATVAAGNTVTLPVRVIANGDENALGFSLSFDPALLSYSSVSLGSGAAAATLLANTSQTANGKLGVAISLPTDTLFAAGTQEVVLVTFQAGVVTTSAVAAISFADQPIGCQLSDAPGNILAATYAGATVTIAAAEFEGDVSPRPGGNRAVTVTDWVMVGRYAARVDYPTNATEFQRADCAPRSTLGDGAIKVTDWVQAGRYAAGLDPLTPAGGPTVEALSGSALLKAAAKTDLNGSARQVKVASPVLVQGENGTVYVTLEAQGNENALGFSLAFDPASLTYAGASLGSAASGATLNVNTNQVGSGRVGFVLALGIGNSFPAGTKEIVKVSFRASASASGSYSVSFADQPVPREVADAGASALSASYLNGAVTVNPALALKITSAGQNITLSWPLWATNCVVQQAGGALASASWTNVPVTLGVSNNENTVTLPAGAGAGFYRLYRP